MAMSALLQRDVGKWSLRGGDGLGKLTQLGK